jgi:hypothetical protein
MKTTNYYDTFIEVAEDCPAGSGEIPPADKATVASLHYAILTARPYAHTSDDVIFQTHAVRNDIPRERLEAERNLFFSKGQACLRSSPLAKRYGWGIHSDSLGRVAIYAVDSAEYRKLASDSEIRHTRGMRSARA